MHFSLPSPRLWPCCGGFLSCRRPPAQRQSPQQGKQSPAASPPALAPAAAKRKKQLQLGQVLSPASVFSASSPAARLGPRSSLLPGLLTSSQMPLGLEVSALHLPPAYDPVPVLDYPRESRFFHRPLPASPEEWCSRQR